MADGNTKSYNPIDRLQEEAMNALASELNEHEKLVQQVIDAATKSLSEMESNIIHRLLLDSQQKRYMVRARLRDMTHMKRYMECMRANGINVVDLDWIRFDGEEHDDKPVDISTRRCGGYVRKWLREKLGLDSEIDETKSEMETPVIEEGADYDFGDVEEEAKEDNKKNVLMKKQMRYEIDLYYMFHDFLKKMRDNRDPEGNATVYVYQEFKDCLKWLGSGVDNQVLKCSLMILNTVNKGIERVIGISRKGKEIVQGTKTRRVDMLFDVFLRLIQHVSILWLASNWMTMEERDVDIVLQTVDGCQRGFREAKSNVKTWSDTLQCRHCSGSCRRS